MKLTPYQLGELRIAIPDNQTLSRVIRIIENETQPLSEKPDFDSSFISENIDLITKAIDFLPISFYIKDRQSRFIFANRHTAYILGQESNSDILGKTDFEFMKESVAHENYDKEQLLISTSTAILNEELSSIDRHGQPLWLLSSKQPIRNASGDVIGLVGVNINITRQKEVEHDLEAERNLLRTLMNMLDGQIFIKDLKSRFIIANHQVVKGTGVEKYEDIVGTTDFDYLPDDVAQKFYEEEQQVIHDGKPIVNKEIQHQSVTSNNLDQWWVSTKAPLYDEDKNIVGLVGFNREITEQKRAQQREIEFELERTRRQILSDFIVGSSHEFRNPIATIQSTSYLLSKSDDPDKKVRYLEKINRQTATLTRLIDMMNQMMVFDRGIQLHKENYPAKTFFNDLMMEFKERMVEKQLTLNVDVSSEVSNIYGDPTLLRQALYSIIENAIAYTHDHGEISLRVTLNQQNIMILIRDTGIGMTQEVVDRVFERFFRADASRSLSGFGLGLSIAKRIIELHRGDISVTSEAGVGSEFIIKLPMQPTYDLAE